MEVQRNTDGDTPSNVEALQQADEALGVSTGNIENIELQYLSHVADSTIRSAGEVETALKTVDDPPLNIEWVNQARREITGLENAATGMRVELVNNLAKLSGMNHQGSVSLTFVYLRTFSCL
ncbi:MAG: hypothetical protein ABW157_22270 [Candidatus Thiodiazotropha sp. LLP2]